MIEINKSVKYILPYLGENIGGKTAKFFDFYAEKISPQRNFVNSFCFNDELKNEVNNFYLLYKLNDRSLYETSLKPYLQRNKNYINCYYPYDGYELFIFNIPEKFYDLKNKFLSGKYSKINTEDKILIYEFSNLLQKGKDLVTDHDTVGVLEKLEWKKNKLNKFINQDSKFYVEITNDMEYESIPNLEKETFSVKKDCLINNLLLTEK